MEKYKLSDMPGGWFIGHFEPSLFKTNDFEVAVKTYRRGDFEKNHFHKIATEFTVIVQGKVKMNGNVYVSGDIIRILPNTSTNFQALTDVSTVVVKVPSATNDKFFTNE